MRNLLFIPLIFMLGCGGLIEYTIITAGTLTGQIAHDQYQKHFGDTPIVQMKYYYDKSGKKHPYHDNSKTEKVEGK